MKRHSLLVLVVVIMCIAVGCKKAENGTTESTVQPSANVDTAENEKQEATEDKVKSRLTGEWVEKEVGESRPYAVMLNNIKVASPQSGIGEASILYECLVEGGITRLMGIYEAFTAERIGSVRSARHYYVSIADEYDAIYVHYGQTIYATEKIEELGIDNLSGLESVGNTVFYRDSSIKAPHNAFTSYEGIQAGMLQKKYRTTYRKNYTSHYEFNEDDIVRKDGTSAGKVTLGFSNSMAPYFVYDSTRQLYGRYQYGVEHIDATTKEQLMFKNILIQYVKEWNIDKNGYQTMDLENASGKGVYITNGKAVNISWKKNETDKTMEYYNESGEKLSVNVGKTYIALFPNNKIENVIIE